MNRSNLLRLIVASLMTLWLAVTLVDVGRSREQTQSSPISPLFMPVVANQRPTPTPTPTLTPTPTRVPVLPTPKPSPTFPPPPATLMRGQAKCQSSNNWGIRTDVYILGKLTGYEVVYSHDPDGQALGKVRGSFAMLFDRPNDLVDADWWIWVRDGNGNRISELVKAHTDSTLGPDKCQHYSVTFWGDASIEVPPGPYGVRIQANQDGTFTARWLFSDRYVGLIQGFRIYQQFYKEYDYWTNSKTEIVATIPEPWRREFTFASVVPLTCPNTNFTHVVFHVEAVYVDKDGQEKTTMTRDVSLIDPIACQ